MKNKLKQIWCWLRLNVFTKEMILPMVLAELIFWSPCIVTGILAITISSWWWAPFSTIIVFWAGPFTPAMELQIGLAFLIKKIRSKIKNGRRK